MNVFFNGFDTNEATFKTTAAVLTGRAVALKNTGEVYYPDEGAPFTGIVSAYRNGLASVVMRGYAVASFKETLPSVGICKLSVGKMGALEVDNENGKPYTIVNVNLTNKTIEFIL